MPQSENRGGTKPAAVGLGADKPLAGTAEPRPVAGYQLRFAGAELVARRSGALWWPGRASLLVADLHLGRAERFARRGGALLPPWGLHDTLARLEAEIEALNPARVISLGDGFDDDRAASMLPAEARHQIARMARGRDWLWISGNHDPAPPGPDLPGRSSPGLVEAGIQLCHDATSLADPPAPHIAEPAFSEPGISGHLHPVVALAGRRWRCFALGRRQLILPAFGSYTGGLEISQPAIRDLIRGGIAITCTTGMFAVPIPAGPRRR